jgi:1-deoxy-D-xylulose-5-phosphate synthase
LLRDLHGLQVGVVNARFIKPLDRATVCKAIEEAAFVLTVEEGCLMGGFGSAVLEAASDAGIPTPHVRRLGLPDRFVMHAERDEQLAEVGLDVAGIIRSAIALAQTVGLSLPELGVDADLDSDRNHDNGTGSKPASPALSAKT